MQTAKIDARSSLAILGHPICYSLALVKRLSLGCGEQSRARQAQARPSSRDTLTEILSDQLV